MEMQKLGSGREIIKTKGKKERVYRGGEGKLLKGRWERVARSTKKVGEGGDGMEKRGWRRGMDEEEKRRGSKEKKKVSNE